MLCCLTVGDGSLSWSGGMNGGPFADVPQICYSCSHLACRVTGQVIFLQPLSPHIASLSGLASWAWHITPLLSNPWAPHLLRQQLGEKGRVIYKKVVICHE